MSNLSMFSPSPPPTPVVTDNDPISADRGWGKENERKRTDQIKQEDEIVLMAIKMWLNNFN